MSKQRPQLAVWHNLPSGGGKRALMQQVRKLAEWADLHLYTTTLVDDSFCPIEPHCVSVTRFPIDPNLFFGWAKITRQWRQGSQAWLAAQAAADQINAHPYLATFVLACQIEHTPSVLRFLKGRSVYYCNEGLREYYEPRPKLEGLKDVLGRILKRPSLLRRYWRDQQAMKAATVVIANSLATQNKLRDWYGVETPVCYPGVDTSVFKPHDKQPNYQGFLSVGRLNQLKGHDFVIRVLGALPKKYRQLTIAFDQDGQAERQRLIALAKTEAVELTFAHRVSEAELCRLYQTSWAVICGQHREPFGLVPIEAMACRGLVCAVAEGGFLETILPDKTGLLVPRDPVQAAAQLLAVLEDAQQTEKIRSAGLADVQARWSWTEHAKQLVKYLQPEND